MFLERRLGGVAALLLSAACAGSWGAEGTAVVDRKLSAQRTAVVEQPRGTGYFVGDLLEQRVLLESDGRKVASHPPAPGRVSAWFDRRSVSVVEDATLRSWLVVQYQVLNAPSKLVTVTLPGWKLSLSGQPGTGAAVWVPPASVNIAPLSPPGTPQQVGAHDLRPDRLPAPTPIAPLRREILYSTGLLILTLVAWFVWTAWRNRRALARQPFARALRAMRGLDGEELSAWRALHRAFDETAGRAVQATTLSALFAQAPQLLPLKAQIEQFYAQSLQRFYAPLTAAAGGLSPRALCLELRRIERRHES